MHLIFPFLGFILGRAAADTTCRCYPGDSCWPTPQQWNDFNQTLGGRLIPIVPLGSVCHTVGQYALYNVQACTNLTANWGFPHTHYQTPSSPMASWFANFSCDPFLPPEVPCELGGLQQYAVNVSGVEDVLATLDFVKQHNIRLVIRNTGHDYLGKSTAPGAVALWMHHLKDTEYLDYTSSYYNGSALRLGAGVQGFEAMRAAHAHDKVIVTGNCESVGVAGGYTQGGGHGQLASYFGLAADQVLEWEIITAAGDLLTASPTENADLFWALSGGGGGTFAVVLSVTVRVHPEMITTSANLTFSRTDVTNSVFWEAVEAFVSSAALLADAGAVAIWMVSNSTFSVTPITWPGATREKLQEHLDPTLAFLDEFNITYSYYINEYPSYWDSYAAMNPHNNVTDSQIGGRLMPRLTLQSNMSELILTLQEIADDGAVISGVSLNVSQPVGISSSVNPAWRNAAISFVIGMNYNSINRSADLWYQSLITDDLIPRLAALSPGGGAYLNEADWNEPNWQDTFYGGNYDALVTVKKKWDSNHIFWARTSVGSEKWAQRPDGRLCQLEGST